MKSLKLTDEARALFEREADIRSQRTSYKVLSAKTGYSEGYISNLVGRMIRDRCVKSRMVSRETKSSRTQAEIDQFAADLMRE